MPIVEVFECSNCGERQDKEEKTYECSCCKEFVVGECCRKELKRCEQCLGKVCENCFYDSYNVCDDCFKQSVCENCGEPCINDEEEGKINGYNECEICEYTFCKLCYVVTYEHISKHSDEVEPHFACKECFIKINCDKGAKKSKMEKV